MKTSAILAIVIVIILIALGIFVYNSSFNISSSDKNSLSKANTRTPVTERDSYQKTYNVNISNFAFSPSELRIKEGDSVVWTNKDSVAHTVTSDFGSELDSTFLSNGQTYSHTFSDKGTFEYHCTPHLQMKAKIIVE